jgi:DNA polymerase-3 subunit delta'
MALKDIVGQDSAITILRGIMAKKRIAHAYLFQGEDGVGKRLTAMNFAKVLNCQSPVYSSQFTVDRKENHSIILDCCDTCPSCKKIDRGIHPDVFHIAPEGGQIKVGAIRKLEESFSLKAFEGKWKIALIDNADTLNQSAANAFLKTLEEPPQQSVLILISSMQELIPLTIRSRCQKIVFSPLPLHKMEELLEHRYSPENGEMSNKEAMLLSLLSGGRPGWALNKDLMKKRDKTFKAFKSLLTKMEEDIWPDRDSMEEWFHWIQLWLRDITVFILTGRNDLLINQDLGKEINEISKKAKPHDILKLSGIFDNIRNSLRFNLNKQLTLYHTYLLLKKTFRGRDA